jgi:CubicO group peptidase (beta-lactamase class C family)
MGEPIADVIANQLTKPFSLMSMRTVTTQKWGGYGGLGVKPHHLAQGYVWNGTSSVPQDYENSTWKVLGGGLQTNALDLARFGALALGGSIVADTARLWTPLTNGATAWNRAVSPLIPTGLAWEVGARPPSRLVRGAITNRQAAEHGGAARGARSFIRLYRDGELVIAILSNQLMSATLTDSNGKPRPHPVGGLATMIATAIFSP